MAALDQLARRGAREQDLRAALKSGRLARTGRWLVIDRQWQPSGPREQWRHELFRAYCSCSPQQRAAVRVFRRSAAVLWGFDGFGAYPLRADAAPIELATGVGRPVHGSVHRVRPFDAELPVIDTLPVTSVTRTLLDLGQVVSRDILERSLEWALRKGHLTVGVLAATLRQASRRPGTHALRDLLAERPEDLPPTESDAETLFVQVVRRSGLPPPERQFLVPTRDGKYRIDFAWPPARLAVEVDGAETHASPNALAYDLRRQNALLLTLGAAWRLLRFSWEDVADPRRTDRVSAQLRQSWLEGGSARTC
ncbi:MAG TPA: DUF559 domain-containing protein [Acidimicrobiales bacterium]|nr:DUF559 domain-containing protein [Acidimicrobiales bacterium]